LFVKKTLVFMDKGLLGFRKHRYEGLKPHKDDFKTDIRAYIYTPEEEEEPAVDMDGELGDVSVHYVGGIMYEDKINRIRAKLNEIFPASIYTEVHTYQAINQDDVAIAPQLETTARGRALYQYDPQASRQEDGSFRRGARLFFERSVVYNERWDAPTVATSFFAQPDLLLECAGQPYDVTQVRYTSRFILTLAALRLREWFDDLLSCWQSLILL